jgi:hypothetical protein
MSKDGAPKARFLLYLKYGAKRRLPSIFGVPCSSFDIPAEGGSFFKRSLEKSVGPSGHLKASLNESVRQNKQQRFGCHITYWNSYAKGFRSLQSS